MTELDEIITKAEYLYRRAGEHSNTWMFSDLAELIIRLAKEIKERTE